MEHTRATLTKMRPQVGDALYSNRRRPILTLIEDTSPGVHDTLIAACDDYRYGLLGCTEYHDNCTDNLSAALYRLGLTPPETPSLEVRDPRSLRPWGPPPPAAPPPSP